MAGCRVASLRPEEAQKPFDGPSPRALSHACQRHGACHAHRTVSKAAPFLPRGRAANIPRPRERRRIGGEKPFVLPIHKGRSSPSESSVNRLFNGLGCYGMSGKKAVDIIFELAPQCVDVLFEWRPPCLFGAGGLANVQVPEDIRASLEALSHAEA
ncbi:hypothetical protein BU16DRAFT_529629 [Lophium mytilinum]|uniref:Uncharacterized protein n=1 Tax=Lophium mytilinum TaxID=390894 RepID=A0A6A6QJZ5_9PEZI|nr:hypothetical protein BU16DRAFT_529629 [Lophium mytilinum]